MTPTSDEQAIRDLYSTWRRATLEEDVGTVVNLIADDAVFLTPGEPPVQGKQQFADIFEDFRGKFRIEAKSEFDEISIHGEWAHVWCRLAVVMSPKSGDAPVFRSGHTLTILHKEAGHWLVTRDANMLAPEPSAS